MKRELQSGTWMGIADIRISGDTGNGNTGDGSGGNIGNISNIREYKGIGVGTGTGAEENMGVGAGISTGGNTGMGTGSRAGESASVSTGGRAGKGIYASAGAAAGQNISAITGARTGDDVSVNTGISDSRNVETGGKSDPDRANGKLPSFPEWFAAFAFAQVPMAGWLYLIYLSLQKRRPVMRGFARAWLAYRFLMLVVVVAIVAASLHFAMPYLEQLLEYLG